MISFLCSELVSLISFSKISIEILLLRAPTSVSGGKVVSLAGIDLTYVFIESSLTF